MKFQMTNSNVAQLIDRLISLATKEYPAQISYCIAKTSILLKNQFLLFKNSESEIIKEYFVINEATGKVMQDSEGHLKCKDSSYYDVAIEKIKSLHESMVDVEIFQFDESILKSLNTITPDECEFFLNFFVKQGDCK